MLDEHERIVLSICEKASRENPTTVKELCLATSLTAANVRNCIANLRSYGYRICSADKGYWVAKNEGDYLAFRGDYMAGITKRLNRLKAMDNTVLNQIEMGAEC